MLAGYNVSSLGLEAAKEELSELVSLANAKGASSSFSGLTETLDLYVHNQGTRQTGNCAFSHQPQLTDCSMDSCLTSSESLERNYEKPPSVHVNLAYDAEQSGTCVLKSIEINSNNNNLSKTNLSNRPIGRKRIRRSTSSDDTGTEKQIPVTLPHQQNSDNQLKTLRFSGDIDLNSQYQSEIDFDRQKLDLNRWIWGTWISSSSLWFLGYPLLMTYQVALGFRCNRFPLIWNCWCSYCHIWKK